MGRAAAQLKPIRAFIAERGWPQRVGTYDQYGGPHMQVMLEPVPTPEQLDELRASFGDACEFASVSARSEQPDLP